MATTTPTTDTQRLGALFELGLVVAERTARGVRVIEARTLGAIAELPAALAQHRVHHLVRVLPAADTVCRASRVDNAQPAELLSALALLGEASLPEDAPAHRRAGGVVPDLSADGKRGAIFTAWITPPPEEPDLPVEDETFIASAAALAMLRAPSGLAVLCDRAGVSIVASGPDRLAARAIVEDPTNPGAIAARIAETCRAVGANAASEVVDSRAHLRLDAASRAALAARVEGLVPEQRWLDQYGVAIGAALAALSPDAVTRSLAQLRDQPPAERRTAPERFAEWVSVPRNALVAGIAAAALVILAPLGIAAARSAVLKSKSANLAQVDEQRAALSKQAAMYQQLETMRWPMTKLIGDISAATPQGVIVEVLRLSPEQGMMIKGTADSQEALGKLQSHLNQTGLFDKLKIDRAVSGSSGVEFDISANVLNPTIYVKPVDDFAEKPLAVRLYGEAARNAPIVATESGSSDRPRENGSGNGASGSRDSGRDVGRESGRESSRDSRSPAPADSSRSSRPASGSGLPSLSDVPPELTDAQIGAMDRTTAMKEMVARRRASSVQGIDPGVKARLDTEVTKLQERMKNAGSGGTT
ncbi:MAG: PilN domain-containing protein [Phycisphaerales bacterium]|jgi:Tfp pilus assembly protein PilN|nr:PilN domain-containing protein [Phycisphaerales bacterium]